MNKLMVKRDDRDCYEIILSKDYSLLGKYLSDLNLTGRKIMIVTDSNVASLYLEQVNEIITASGCHCSHFIFPAGEASKNLDTVSELYAHLIQEHFDRKDVLVALGGGVVGDLTGFTAATYLRGISFIQLPTTLLAQVDSSIGGKTGVDYQSYKNMVGAFYMPRLVYMNMHTLSTLSDDLFSCGMGEVLKHGLILDESYFHWCQIHHNEILAQKKDFLEEMVYKSCQIKACVVEKDPTEQGIRKLLNFGHTIGHAVEKNMDFKLLHGQCVAIGAMAAAVLSENKGYLTKADVDQIKQTFENFGLPTHVKLPENVTSDTLLDTSKSDKKMDAGRIQFILLEKVGRAVVNRSLTDSDLKYGIDSIVI